MVTAIAHEDFCRIASGDADNDYGIRPAFYLDESTAVILSGNGAEHDPYVVNGGSMPEQKK